MKCALVIANGIKQIMFTAETDEEKSALNMITPDQDLSVDIKSGTFYDDYSVPQSALGYMVYECQGGYIRTKSCANSLMIVLRPKKKETD